jgi:hypothetical protein
MCMHAHLHMCLCPMCEQANLPCAFVHDTAQRRHVRERLYVCTCSCTCTTRNKILNAGMQTNVRTCTTRAHYLVLPAHGPPVRATLNTLGPVWFLIKNVLVTRVCTYQWHLSVCPKYKYLCMICICICICICIYIYTLYKNSMCTPHTHV